MVDVRSKRTRVGATPTGLSFVAGTSSKAVSPDIAPAPGSPALRSWWRPPVRLLSEHLRVQLLAGAQVVYNPTMLDERYAAGFFDGEGCVHIARNVRVILAGCFCPGLLDQFAQRWGGTVRRASWSNRSRRPGVRWEITGTAAVSFLRDVADHLIEKREQALAAIEYQSYKASTGVRGGKGYTQEQKVRIREMEQRLREMKKPVHAYDV